MMGSWINTALGDICTIKIGGTPSRSNPLYWDSNNDEDNYWVSIKDLNQRVVINTEERITTLGTKKSNAKLVKKGTVLMSFKLTIGRVAYAGVDLYTNEAIAALAADGIDKDFLFQGLQYWNLLQDVDQAIKGATLNKAKLHKIKLYIPSSKPEQTRISGILSTADTAIAQTDALIAKYQRIKTGLMQDLLTRGIDANGNIRSKATHRFVVKNGIEVPEEWEVVAFKELCALIKDGTHLPPKRVEDGIWLLGVSNIIAGEWKLTSSDTQVSEEFYNEMHRNWEIEVGDVLLAIVGATIGKVTQVPKDFPKFTLQRSVCVLRGITNELSNDFLRLYIESPFFYRALWNEVNVTAQPGIYLDTIGKFFIPKPSYEEQLRIVKNAATMKTVIDNFKDNLSKLHLLKTGLMQDLLSGRVRVKVNNG